MPSPEIEEFAREIVTLVRDEAIRSCDMNFQPQAKYDQAILWKKMFPEGEQRKNAKEIIPEAVDAAIFYLLHALDNGLIQMFYKSSDGKLVDLVSEGQSEMAGWYSGSESWRERFSKERLPLP